MFRLGAGFGKAVWGFRASPFEEPNYRAAVKPLFYNAIMRKPHSLPCTHIMLIKFFTSNPDYTLNPEPHTTLISGTDFQKGPLVEIPTSPQFRIIVMVIATIIFIIILTILMIIVLMILLILVVVLNSAVEAASDGRTPYLAASYFQQQEARVLQNDLSRGPGTQ